MRKLRSTRRAIFVLESPWQLDAGDANRTSVLPFIEGIGKYAGDTEVFHANFYDKSSFKQALKCLAKTQYESAVVYVAAHGNESEIGGVKTRELLSEIGKHARSLNLTGVLLGSCLAGGDTERMEKCTEGTNIRWCGGYSASISWLEGTLLDCAILSQMLALDEEDFEEVDKMVDAIAQAVAPFSKTFGIGSGRWPASLEQSIEFVVQATGKGKTPKTVTSEIFDAWDKKQVRPKRLPALATG
jgi:hypothetical protein